MFGGSNHSYKYTASDRCASVSSSSKWNNTISLVYPQENFSPSTCSITFGKSILCAYARNYKEQKVEGLLEW